MIGEVSAEDYRKYRGKCKEMSEALCKEDPSLKLVRGHYHDPFWREPEPHWWCVKPDGTIVDPTKDQFPSKGMGEYIEYDGSLTCAQCGAGGTEEEALKPKKTDGWHLDQNGRYAYCSNKCHARFVGLDDY